MQRTGIVGEGGVLHRRRPPGLGCPGHVKARRPGRSSHIQSVVRHQYQRAHIDEGLQRPRPSGAPSGVPLLSLCQHPPENKLHVSEKAYQPVNKENLGRAASQAAQVGFYVRTPAAPRHPTATLQRTSSKVLLQRGCSCGVYVTLLCWFVGPGTCSATGVACRCAPPSAAHHPRVWYMLCARALLCAARNTFLTLAYFLQDRFATSRCRETKPHGACTCAARGLYQRDVCLRLKRGRHCCACQRIMDLQAAPSTHSAEHGAEVLEDLSSARAAQLKRSL